jgi:hypothetical protein
LLGQVRAKLLSSFDGQLEGLEGLVVVRDEPEGMTAEEIQVASEFETGLIEGATSARVPTVGVELTTTPASQIPWYKAQDMSSVDDLDTTAGRTALAFTLAGAHGAYGEKSTADAGLVPRVAGGTSIP